MMFKSYTAVTRISHLWKRIAEIQQQLKTQLDADFDALYVSLNCDFVVFIIHDKATSKTLTSQLG
jgi:hypothetical protein